MSQPARLSTIGTHSVGLPLTSGGLQPGNPAAPLDFIVKSGRILVHPIYQGTYERFKGPFDSTDGLTAQRRWVEWRWDIGRVLDYLETRADVDAQRIGYVGVSFGASFPVHVLALERRFKAAVLIGGGLLPEMSPPSADPIHYVPRITMPVLMINGRFDYVFPLDAQAAFFDRLGTPAQDKRRVIVEAGHVVSRSDVLRESLGWLDEHLGSVR